MSNKIIIENKISAIKKYLDILKSFQGYTQAEIENDVQIRGAIERYLYLAIQATIELAEAEVAYKKLRKPQTMAEAFIILEENKLISQDLMGTMVKMVGFRNIIAHDYEKINYEIVENILQNGVKDIKEFIKKVQKSLNLR